MRRPLCIILAVCFAMNCFTMTGTTASDYAPQTPSALILRAPIRIDNNTCFNATNGVTGGDGSAATPWIIENYEINGTGNGSCIYIGNTTDNFIVRNCLLYNASGGVGGIGAIYRYNASVMLFNVSHGTLLNNTLRWNEYGIYLYSNSVNNTMVQNVIDNNYGTGILMDSGSNGNEVFNNTIFGNGLHGVYIYSGSFNTLKNNTVHGNANSGIYLYSSVGNTILNNTVHHNTIYGMHIYLSSEFNLLRYNNISDNGYGVRISNSKWNTIYTNDFVGNTDQAYDNSATNRWNWDYPDGGNYWDDYTGIDVMNGPSQNVPGSDGFGDTSYTNIDGGAGASDSYPLMNPFNWTPSADAVPPHAVSWGPLGNSTQANANIFIRWNESMDWASVEAAFGYTDGTRSYTSANGTWSHDLTFNSTFTPTEPLDYETAYTVTVNCTARDFAGNYLDQDGDGTGSEWPSDVLTWNFTTTDQAPYVVSTVPADGQVDVDPNKPIKIMFSERMNASSVEEGFSYTNGTETWGQAHGLVYWDAGYTEFAFSPAEPLGLNETFYVTLNGTARDYGGKTLEGGNYTWIFRTWLEPPAPHVIDTYPPTGSTNVNVNTYINIAFDTEMDPMTMSGSFSYTDGIDVWDLDNGTYDWFSDNTLFSFQPTERLRFDSAYTVCITSNATSVYGKHLDGNDNGIPDASDDFVFIFTTIPEPPTVASHYPLSNQMNVPVTLSAIYINFSKIMIISSVTNAVSVYPTTPFTPSFSGAGMNLTLVLAAELLQGTQYRVTVLGTAMDMDGIKLDGNGDGWPGDKFVFTFFTEGVEVPEMPRIVSVFPANNATVPVDAFFVTVSFNVVMNKTSVEQAFKFINGTQQLNGTFTWHVSGKIFRFTPTDLLAYNTTYTVSIQGTAEDESGNTLGNTTVWHYITVAAEQTTDWMDWVLYCAVAFLIAMVVILYMANRSLRRDLKRTRVKLKRLKREMGIEDEPEKPVEPTEPEEGAPEQAEPEEAPAD